MTTIFEREARVELIQRISRCRPLCVYRDHSCSRRDHREQILKGHLDRLHVDLKPCSEARYVDGCPLVQSR